MAVTGAGDSQLPDRTYLPKLDGLRGISIILVLVQHFLWSGHGILKGTLPVGSLGVTSFFVISGYLITSILVTYANTLSFKASAVKFYWRRMLRLSPIYYLCIALTAAFGIGGMRANWWVNGLYLMNFKVAADKAWNGSSHFWTLAVEEQFYLLWFFVVVLTPRRLLLPVIVFFLASGPLWRAATGGGAFETVLLPGVIDSLATGALLSYAVNSASAPQLWRVFARWRSSLLVLSTCLIIGTEVWPEYYVSGVLLNSALSFFSACLVLIAIDKQSAWWSGWLGRNPLRHLGKISYGLYVYHNFVPQIIVLQTINEKWLSGIHNPVALRFIQFLVFTGISISIAEISWRLIERPILRFKDRFPRPAARVPEVRRLSAVAGGASVAVAADGLRAPFLALHDEDGGTQG